MPRCPHPVQPRGLPVHTPGPAGRHRPERGLAPGAGLPAGKPGGFSAPGASRGGRGGCWALQGAACSGGVQDGEPGACRAPPHTRGEPHRSPARCSCRWGRGRAAAPGSLRVFGSPKAAGGPARAWRGCQAQSPTWEAANSAYGPGRWHPVWGRRVREAKRKRPNTAPGRLAGTSGGTGCGLSPGVGAEGLILPGFPTP